MHAESLSPRAAYAAVLAGRTVRSVVGTDPDDPVCLHYLDRCYEFDYKPQIYTESVGGWSTGVKEAICKPGDGFYVGFVADSLSLTVTDETPPQREAPAPVCLVPDPGEGARS